MSKISIASAWLRVSIWGLGLSLVAGCGGGSSGGGGTGGGGNPTTVTFTFKGATPTVVAAKIGSGAYAAQSLSSGTLTLSLPSGTTDFAVSYACPPQTFPPVGVLTGTSTRQTVFEASTADGTSFTLSCAQTPAKTQGGTLTGSVDASALPAYSFLQIEAANGDSLSGTVAGQNGSFSFAAPAGTDRVEVLAYLNSPVGTFPPSSGLVAVRTFDSQPVPGALNGGNPVVFTAADQTIPQSVTYKNVPAGFAAPTLQVMFNIAGKSSFVVGYGSGTAYPALPAAAVEAGDSYLFIAADYQTSIGGVGLGQAVVAAATTPTGGPMTFSFPAPWSYSGPTPAALPTFDFTYAGFSGNAGLQRLAALTWLTGGNENIFTLIATGNYGSGSTQATFPDLSALTGFLAAPSSGTTVRWSAEIGQYSYAAGQTPPSSSTASAVVNAGAYTIP
jgi:hypothetical protein